MIQHVVEKAQLVSQDAFVATDDQRIYDRVVGFGGKVVMTSADHKSGTDRCCEAYRHIVADYRKTYDVVVNIQGDEPFIQPEPLSASDLGRWPSRYRRVPVVCWKPAGSYRIKMELRELWISVESLVVPAISR